MKAASIDEGRAVQRLRGPEHGAAERMGDHDVIANFNGEQGTSLSVSDGLAKYAAPGVKNIGQPLRQIVERNRRCQQGVEHVHRSAGRARRRAGGRGSSAAGATARSVRPGSISAVAGGYGRRRPAVL